MRNKISDMSTQSEDETASVASSSLDDLMGVMRQALIDRNTNNGSTVPRIGRFEILRELARGTFGALGQPGGPVVAAPVWH